MTDKGLGGQFDEVVVGAKDSFGQEIDMKPVRDSTRYIKLQNNYRYFDCRSDLNVVAIDDIDHDIKPKEMFSSKTYMNTSKKQSRILKKSYKKMHQDA